MFPTGPDLTGCTEALILPLEDPTVDPHGFDPRSTYAETFWLPILGPSTMWLLRHIAAEFDDQPEGFRLDITEASTALGIRSKGGKHTVFSRSMGRIVSFGMGNAIDDTTIAVRRIMPQLHGGQIARLTPRLRTAHNEATKSVIEDDGEAERRSIEVATALIGIGERPDDVEHQLVRWGVRPSIANHAVNVAWADKARREARAS